MRHQRCTRDENDNHATTWTVTAMSVLDAVVRWLIVLLADHLAG
ncbi:hypothetical protein QLQ12_16785 [Actinoplanes sp. NEAU-A12]|uniref:Uncharacterized protein n=1 Tax=Actinoplanes sandaracinus TaxID=3045177 RepID=A0ABT6WKL9_9ACTN|nr:hypothetical protein [Actinoplanes sandaracinus]MDI6100263.1 hypothetical protein [Actinoplanes sandaracinus]